MTQSLWKRFTSLSHAAGIESERAQAASLAARQSGRRGDHVDAAIAHRQAEVLLGHAADLALQAGHPAAATFERFAEDHYVQMMGHITPAGIRRMAGRQD